MSTILKRSVGQVACAVVGHYVSEDEEDRLYRKPMNLEGTREIETVCTRCNAKLQLKVDSTNEDEYFVTEI